MDRIPDSGSDDGGSIPPGCTCNKFMRLTISFYIVLGLILLTGCTNKKSFELKAEIFCLL